MKVRGYAEWVRHISRSLTDEIYVNCREGAGGNHQVWAATSSGGDKIYTVVYHANHFGEFISCNCPAGKFDRQCKHAAQVLLCIQPVALMEIVLGHGVGAHHERAGANL